MDTQIPFGLLPEARAMNCSQRGCPNPTGAECHCSGCHETYSGITLFDAHQSWTPFKCNPPAADLGASRSDGTVLVQNNRGTWCTAGELARRTRFGAQYGTRSPSGSFPVSLPKPGHQSPQSPLQGLGKRARKNRSLPSRRRLALRSRIPCIGGTMPGKNPSYNLSRVMLLGAPRFLRCDWTGSSPRT
jgi:hypothetical protein